MPQTAPINSTDIYANGVQTTLDITAAAVIKASPGHIGKIVVVAPGTTSGSLVVNDSATTAGAATANQILNIAFGSMTAGQVISLGFPCKNGIVVSAVPTAGSPQYCMSWS